MTKKIWFDMDGTIADLYGVENWLAYLIAEDTTPYAIAKPLLNLSILARYLNKVQKLGYEIGIISWGSKNGTEEYFEKVACAKYHWLLKHLPSVEWDYVKFTNYGVNKWETCRDGILFDDEAQNRTNWGGESYEPCQIIEVLKSLVKNA